MSSDDAPLAVAFSVASAFGDAAPFDLEFTIPMTGCARAAVISQALTSLAFLLAQTPVPPESLRKWAISFNAAEALVAASRGGRLPPRSAPARKTLDYLSRLDALDRGVRNAAAVSVVHAAVLVFGPTPLAPRLVVHVAFEGDSVVVANNHEHVTAAAAVSPSSLPQQQQPLPGYDDEFSPAIAAAVARKVARTLITAGPELFGGSLPTMSPLPMHVFLLASSRTTGGHDSVTNSIMPEGWLPRPRFVLRVRVRTTTLRRIGSKPRRPRYELADLRVRGPPLPPDSATANSDKPTTVTTATTIDTHHTAPAWWQWNRAPKGLRIKGLPPMPKLKRTQAITATTTTTIAAIHVDTTETLECAAMVDDTSTEMMVTETTGGLPRVDDI